MHDLFSMKQKKFEDIMKEFEKFRVESDANVWRIWRQTDKVEIAKTQISKN